MGGLLVTLIVCSFAITTFLLAHYKDEIWNKIEFKDGDSNGKHTRQYK